MVTRHTHGPGAALAGAIALAAAAALAGLAIVTAFTVARIVVDAPTVTMRSDWRTVPAVWWTEILLAISIAVAGALAVRSILRQPFSLRHTIRLFGVCLVALGALTLAVGCVGLAAPTIGGSNDLERREWLFVIAGAAMAAVGGLVTLPRALAAASRGPSHIEADGTGRS